MGNYKGKSPLVTKGVNRAGNGIGNIVTTFMDVKPKKSRGMTSGMMNKPKRRRSRR